MASKTVVISADDRGPWIIIVTWVLGVVMCLSSFTKVLSKRVRSQEVQNDDIYVIIATVYLSCHLALQTLGFVTWSGQLNSLTAVDNRL